MVSAGAVDAGLLSDIIAAAPLNGAFIRRGHFVLVRNDSELYAISSVCTHRNCDVKVANAKSATALYCPCHGAEFDASGQVMRGPARLPLKRLAISLNAKQHVIVDPSRPLDDQDDPQGRITLPQNT
jgi:Rieske Fe-S protein